MKHGVPAAIARWMRTHDGVITSREAAALGASPHDLRLLVSSGRWMPVHRGIYVEASTVVTARVALRCALAAAGDGALVSHLSAAWLWELVDRAPSRPTITVSGPRRVRLSGVVSHRSRVQPAPRRLQGLVVTDPARTIVDVAGTGSPIGPLVDRALSQRLVTVRGLEEATVPSARAHRSGTIPVRAYLEYRGHLGGPGPSVLESRMAPILKRAHDECGLPMAVSEIRCRQGRYRIDFGWPPIKLGIDVHGWAWHNSASHLAHDTRRSNALQEDGWTLLAYTWAQTRDEVEVVLAEIVRQYWGKVERLSRGPGAAGTASAASGGRG